MEVSKFLDHGTANPIVARLTSQTFAILDACNLSKEAADKIKVVYMQALTKRWCGVGKSRCDIRASLLTGQLRERNFTYAKERCLLVEQSAKASQEER